MTQTEQKNAAKKFADYWKDRGYEKGESQKFWIDLLTNVYGVTDIAGFISFEDQVKLDHTFELCKAHQPNDRAVMEAYGFWGKLNSESKCVAELMGMYREITKEEKNYVKNKT